MFLSFVKKHLCLKGITFAGTKEFSDAVSVPFQEGAFPKPFIGFNPVNIFARSSILDV